MAAEKSALPKIVKDFGNTRLVFDVAKMTPEMIDKVKNVVAEVKSKDSIYIRYPATPGKDHGEYMEEASQSDPELIRGFDETPEAHAKRVFTPKMDTADKAYDILEAIAPLFDQPIVPRSDFNTIPMHEIRTFVFNVLNFCDCPTAGEFIPKRITDGKQFR